MATRPAWVYIIECADGTLYTGWTYDLTRRFVQHVEGKGAKYTRGRGGHSLRLVYKEKLASKKRAMQRERQIKKMRRGQKLELINNHWREGGTW